MVYGTSLWSLSSSDSYISLRISMVSVDALYETVLGKAYSLHLSGAPSPSLGSQDPTTFGLVAHR